MLVSLFSLLLVLVGGFLLLALTHRITDWSHRRSWQFFVLCLPVLFFAAMLCVSPLASQVTLPERLVFYSIVGFALSALILGMVRIVLMVKFVARHALFMNVTLQERVNALAQELDIASPRVRLYPSNQPAALTCGICRPTILLSTWIVQHLDHYEIEAVLIHEMEHVVRRDYLIVWLSTILRDAFCYLPTSQIAYRQLKREKELACDDLTISVTKRPLALASALTRFWLYAVEAPRGLQLEEAQTLVAAQESINDRIERLLASADTMKARQSASLKRPVTATALRMPSFFLSGLGIFLLTMVTLMSCNGAMLLERFF